MKLIPGSRGEHGERHLMSARLFEASQVGYALTLYDDQDVLVGFTLDPRPSQHGCGIPILIVATSPLRIFQQASTHFAVVFRWSKNQGRDA